jgi:hypothetical protein
MAKDDSIVGRALLPVHVVAVKHFDLSSEEMCAAFKFFSLARSVTAFCIKGWKVFLTEELSRTINDVRTTRDL